MATPGEGAIAGSPDSSGHALLWPRSTDVAANKEDAALQLCRQCVERKVSGVFFAPLEMTAHSVETNREVLRVLQAAEMPVVLLDRRAESVGARRDLVGIDNHRAGYLAAAHLVRLGSLRIGFIAYRGQAGTVQSRIAGYNQALAEGQQEQRVFYLEPESPLRLPDLALECDGFVCANDRIAGYLMHLLLARGIRIPQDIRVLGMDDVRYAALLPLPLTTIHQPCREIGETALRVMLERLDRPKMPARDVLFDCELIVRESCGTILRMPA